MSKAKPTKVSNKNLILDAIKALEEETGFHFIDVEFGDTYFIATGPKDSICHFHIKEIPKFKFALWNTCRFDSIKYEMENDLQLWSDYYSVNSNSELIFFSQYERDLDKFKPSYSDNVQGIYRTAWYEKSVETNRRIKKEEWYLADIPDILNWMHKHPIKAYVYSGYANNIWDEISNIRVLKTYINSNIGHYKYKFKRKHEVNKDLKAAKRLIKKLKTMDYLLIKKDHCYPELELRLRVQTGSRHDWYVKDVERISKFQDKYRSHLSIEPWFIDSDVELTDDEEKEDKDLKKRFYSYAEDVINIVKGNSKETLEDWWIEKVIDYNLTGPYSKIGLEE